MAPPPPRTRRDLRPQPVLKAPGRVAPGDALRAVIIVALLLFVLLAVPSLLSAYWLKVLTGAAIYSVVALGLNVLMGRVGLVSLGQIAVLALGAWVAAKLMFSTSMPFPLVLLFAGLITMVLGTLGRPAGAASERALPGADHADDGRGDHGRARDHELPERRPGLPRAHRVVARRRRHAAPARDRRDRPRVLPLHGGRGRADVPARRSGTSATSRAAPGRRSARASRRRSPRA